LRFKAPYADGNVEQDSWPSGNAALTPVTDPRLVLSGALEATATAATGGGGGGGGGGAAATDGVLFTDEMGVALLELRPGRGASNHRLFDFTGGVVEENIGVVVVIVTSLEEDAAASAPLSAQTSVPLAIPWLTSPSEIGSPFKTYTTTVGPSTVTTEGLLSRFSAWACWWP